jgi:hypothetical protein
LNAKQFIIEIERDIPFLDAVRALFVQNCVYWPMPTDFMIDDRQPGLTMFFHAVSLYAVIRLVKPKIVVETGGTPGKSSAFMLRAMERNGFGELWTVDLPPSKTAVTRLPRTDLVQFRVLPPGKSSGWAVPDWLKTRQHTVLGVSQEKLPPLLKSLNIIDIFIHDSDHSYEHMLWEFETAWPHIRSGGLLLSDDAWDNNAFVEFCESKHVIPYWFLNQAGTIKP